MTLLAHDDIPVTGKVTVEIAGGVSITSPLVDGRAAIELPKTTTVGVLDVTVTYGGSSVAKKVEKAITITVTK